MTRELERRAGKGPADHHPLDEADPPGDHSHAADPRVAQPGDDPIGDGRLGAGAVVDGEAPEPPAPSGS